MRKSPCRQNLDKVDSGEALAARASPESTLSRFWRHGDFLIQSGNCDYEQTFFTVTRHHDFSIPASLEHRFQAIEPQAGFWPLAGMASKARGLENGPNVFCVRQPTFLCRGWKFA